MARKDNDTAKVVKKLAKSKYFGVFLIIVIILVAAFVLYCSFNPEFYNSIFGPKGGEPLRTKEDVIKYYDTPYVVKDGEDLKDLKIHTVDVGQGDAIIVELPDGANVLIDGGKSSESDKLLAYVESLNIDVFDVVILTHSDEDHIGGIDEIFENYVVKNCYRPFVKYNGSHFEIAPDFNDGSATKSHDTKSYGKVLNAIYNETYLEGNQNYYCNWEFFNADSEFGRELVFGGKTYEYKFDFLTPTKNFEEIAYTDLNDFSPYILFTYGEKGVEEGDNRLDLLFTGDAEETALEELLDYYSTTNLDVDILKAGHHGSRTSTTPEFLDKITPEHTLISCGKGNSYKHPHQEILNYFVDDNINIWRTDVHGSIIITCSELGDYLFSYTATSVNNADIFVGGA